MRGASHSTGGRPARPQDPHLGNALTIHFLNEISSGRDTGRSRCRRPPTVFHSRLPHRGQGGTWVCELISISFPQLVQTVRAGRNVASGWHWIRHFPSPASIAPRRCPRHGRPTGAALSRGKPRREATRAAGAGKVGSGLICGREEPGSSLLSPEANLGWPQRSTRVRLLGTLPLVTRRSDRP